MAVMVLRYIMIKRIVATDMRWRLLLVPPADGDAGGFEAVDTSSDMYVDVTIDVVSDIGLELLTGVNANVLVTVATAFWFAMPAP